MTLDVAVVGAGISGLAAAYQLHQQGYRVAVLERQVRAGGKARSERFGGFLMERGPSTVNAAAGPITTWSRALGLDALRVELGPGVRRRYLVAHGALTGIPLHPYGFLASAYLSWPGRLRVLAEIFAARREPAMEESVAEFFTRRFGREFMERVMEPLVAGMFAGSPERMAMADSFPALVTMERRCGSVLRGLIDSRLRGGRMPGRQLCSWHAGIGALPGALAQGLAARISTGVAVRRIRRRGQNGFRIDTARHGWLDVPAVVIATQAHVTSALVEHLAPGAAAAAATIEAPSLAIIFLGYRRHQIDHPLDGLGYLSPRSEGRKLAGVLFSSTMFEGRAPEGYVALTAYAGGARAPELARLPAEELIRLTRAELAELLGVRGPPVIAQVQQWERGLPQYTMGHPRRVAALGEAEATVPGLFFTGNYLGGVSVSACLDRAACTAMRVTQFLHSRSQGLPGVTAAVPATSQPCTATGSLKTRCN